MMSGNLSTRQGRDRRECKRPHVGRNRNGNLTPMPAPSAQSSLRG